MRLAHLLSLLVLMLLAPACSSSEDGDATTTTACQGLDEAACEGAPTCVPLHGQEFPISGAQKYVGCWTGYGEDGSAFSCTTLQYCTAAPGSDAVFLMGSCGPPDGWQQVTCPFPADVADDTDHDDADVQDISGAPCDRGVDPLMVTESSVVGRYLVLDVSYSGGCEDHEFAVWWSGVHTASNPPVAPLELHHNANGDSCEAVISEQIAIDLSALDAIASTPDGGGAAAVRVDLWGAWPDAGAIAPESLYEVPTEALPAPSGATVLPIELECGGITP